jgi:hypothetical protein
MFFLSIEVVQLISVVDRLIRIDQFEMPHDIFLDVYWLSHLIDQIFFVENNPILVHVVIFNNRNKFSKMFFFSISTYRDSRPWNESDTFESGNLSPEGNTLKKTTKFNWNIKRNISIEIFSINFYQQSNRNYFKSSV